MTEQGWTQCTYPGLEDFLYRIEGKTVQLKRKLSAYKGSGPKCKPLSWYKGSSGSVRYLEVTVSSYENGKRKTQHVRAHKLVGYEKYGCHCKPGFVDAHQNGDHLDNRMVNIRRKTYKANAADAKRHGRWKPQLNFAEYNQKCKDDPQHWYKRRASNG